ncbi:hypothetical protein SCLCIDRAFT_1217684 [Scleroderma citrinum Foug A]|uniref:Uncharacterized protein n=1 Tax=Scleroderma citrinum Foug A TaxID=1036808 RepID=A0A0C3DTP4_9AGAM|nr:hypothetical protein SCLCIDRAFT_1217684 [Scleroderma citrinum Foug A]
MLPLCFLLQLLGVPGPSRVFIRANQMFFYPLVYIVVVLPISGARFSAPKGNTVPFAVTASTDALFALSGLFNVVLFSHPHEPHTAKSLVWCAFSASSPFYFCGKDRASFVMALTPVLTGLIL